MALQIISVVLFTVFFSEALTLTCYDCTTGTNIPAGTCSSTAICSSSSQCSSVTTYNVSHQFNEKRCENTSCVNWSINFGSFMKSSKCCSSNNCNNDTASDSANELSCYACNGTNVTYTLKCKGVEDRCFTAEVESSGTFKGCASKNLCDSIALLNSTLPRPLLKSSCCEANLCNVYGNNAQKMTQGPVLLLVPILSLLFYILDLF